MTQPTEYACGFLFSADRRRLALIRKNRPARMAGRLNGVGGKVDPGESRHDCMVREFEEEAGVRIAAWRPIAVLRYGNQGVVTFYVAFSDRLYDVESRTDEDVFTAYYDYALTDPELMDNLRQILPLAQQAAIGGPIHSLYEEPDAEAA